MSAASRHLAWAATRSIASRLCSTSAAVVAHEETLTRMAARPRQTVPPHQQVPSSWMPAITRRVVSSSPEAHQYLVQSHLIEDVKAGGA